MLLYLFMALGISFTCSVLEAVLLSTPMSFITMKEQDIDKDGEKELLVVLHNVTGRGL